MEVASDLFENWQTALEEFHKGVKKDLREIRKYKEQVRQMKMEIMDRLEQGTYIQDDHRIVLSAPEIVIGNVDADGVLKSGTSSVIVRGSHVGLEGVGSNEVNPGRVTTRAAVIEQVAVDPGPDGVENVVKNVSVISSQARSLNLVSRNTMGLFTDTSSRMGICLQSDTCVDIDSTLANKSKATKLDDLSDSLKKNLKNNEEVANQQKKEVESLIKELNDIVKRDTFDLDLDTIRTSVFDIAELHEDFNEVAKKLYGQLSLYMRSISQLAETNRQIDCVEDEKKKVSKKKADFDKKSTGTSVSIKSERVNISSIDGDGDIRTNDGAGTYVSGRNFNVVAYNDKGNLIEDGAIRFAAKNVSISTADPDIKDNKGKCPVVGMFSVSSKFIMMDSVDYEVKDGKWEETKLNKNSVFQLRTENVHINTTGTDGKVDGNIELNSKKIEVKSMDVDKEKREDKSLATGGTLLLLSEKVFTGSRDKKVKSKSLQLASDEIAVIGEKTVELQQGKALVQLDGGDASMSGGKTQFYGTTTLFGKTAFKSDLEAGDIDVKNIKIKSSFKSPCTSEGMAVPGAPSTAKLSAKLKEEELKKDK